MKIIVGLGNPGKKHKKTRHNLGFMVIDKITQNYNLKLKVKKKIEAEIIERRVDGKKVILVKPMTYMNNSGKVIKTLISQYLNILISDLIIIHDDVDLPLGRIKVKRGGGSAGHHGVESIIKELGVTDFVRVRLGTGKNGDVEGFVLSPFKKEEKEEVDKMLNKACEQIYALL